MRNNNISQTVFFAYVGQRRQRELICRNGINKLEAYTKESPEGLVPRSSSKSVSTSSGHD